MKQSLEVTIGGQRYLLRTDSDGNQQRLERLAALVNEKLAEVRNVAQALSGERLAVLAALNLADDLLKEQEAHGALRRDIRRRSDALLGYLRPLTEQARQSRDAGEEPT